MQKIYKIKIQDKEFEIIQDEDGKFIKPDIIFELEKCGTATKPAHEPICLARKPLSEKSVALNVLKWGTGGINIDESRIEYSETNKPIPQLAQGKTEIKTNEGMYGGNSFNESKTKSTIGGSLQGRFPANLILDEEAGKMLDKQSGIRKTNLHAQTKGSWVKSFIGEKDNYGEYKGFGDSGGASRFFYCAKASRSERNMGCEGLELREIYPQNNSLERKELNATKGERVHNNHPTVKPIALMEYLITMITPKGGIVLDPFTGSGSTGVACKELGFDFIGIELDPEYIKIAEARINGVPDKLF